MAEEVQFVLIGVVVGILGGMLGFGGGILIVPILVFIYGWKERMAEGTTLAMMCVPIVALAVWKYYQAGHVKVRAMLIMAAAFFWGGFFGARIAEHVPQQDLIRFLGVVLLVTSVKMLWPRRNESESAKKESR